MVSEATNATEILFVCPDEDCGRRVVFHRTDGFTVIERGDERALHSGSQGPVSMSMSLGH